MPYDEVVTMNLGDMWPILKLHLQQSWQLRGTGHQHMIFTTYAVYGSQQCAGTGLVGGA